MRFLIFFLSFALFFVSSVSGASPTVELAEDSTTPFNIIKRHKLALYEPPEGCYLGGYVLSSKSVENDMAKFDEATGKEHSIYVYNMRLGDAYPTTWVLQCIAQKKTPMINIYPPDTYSPYQEEQLEKCAKEFGDFYVPVFVSFYPNPQHYETDSESYTSYYRAARTMFKQFATNAAFVWSVSSGDVYDSAQYYPGDEYVDWVGINIFAPVYVDDKPYSRDIWKDISFFYNSYQIRKPIMLSSVGISHFSTRDHAYKTDYAIKKITGIYETLARRYPRIKAAVYFDTDNTAISLKSGVRDNFSITGESSVLNAYSSAIADDYFLSEVDVYSSGNITDETFVSAFKLCADADTGQPYISRNAMYYELDITSLYKAEHKCVLFNNEEYYPLDFICAMYNIEWVTDGKLNGITIKIP